MFEQERARAQELRRSYLATVRGRSPTPSKRATRTTGKHAERVTAYGMDSPARSGSLLEESPQIEFGFLLHDIGKVRGADVILFKTSQLTG